MAVLMSTVLRNILPQHWSFICFTMERLIKNYILRQFLRNCSKSLQPVWTISITKYWQGMLLHRVPVSFFPIRVNFVCPFITLQPQGKDIQWSRGRRKEKEEKTCGKSREDFIHFGWHIETLAYLEWLIQPLVFATTTLDLEVQGLDSESFHHWVVFFFLLFLISSLYL